MRDAMRSIIITVSVLEINTVRGGGESTVLKWRFLSFAKLFAVFKENIGYVSTL